MRPTRLLLDTHVFLWWRTNDPQLGESGRDTIANADVVYVSAASAWEAAIKLRLEKLRLPEPFAAGVANSGFTELPVRFAHAEATAALPLHHHDPFDRLLVAQAIVEKLTLVTRDPQIGRYDVALAMV